MKRLVLFTVLFLIISIGTAHAAVWIGSVNSGTDGWINNVRTWEWQETGSGISIGVTPFTPLQPGQIIDFYYQSRLDKFLNASNNDISTPNLNMQYEFTAVAKIQERVVAFNWTDLNGNFIPDLGDVFNATFVPISGQAWLLFDQPNDSVVGTGNGFDDGIIIAKADVIPNSGGATFTLLPDGSGVGGTGLNFLADPTWIDTNYLDPGYLITDMHFDSSQTFPPGTSATNAFFGPDNAGIYALYNVTANDTVYKVDGSSYFTTVPEPNTLILLGAGLTGLGLLRRFRKK